MSLHIPVGVNQLYGLKKKKKFILESQSLMNKTPCKTHFLSGRVKFVSETFAQRAAEWCGNPASPGAVQLGFHLAFCCAQNEPLCGFLHRQGARATQSRELPRDPDAWRLVTRETSEALQKCWFSLLRKLLSWHGVPKKAPPPHPLWRHFIFPSQPVTPW